MSSFNNADNIFTTSFDDMESWGLSGEPSSPNWHTRFLGEPEENRDGDIAGYPLQLQASAPAFLLDPQRDPNSTIPYPTALQDSDISFDFNPEVDVLLPDYMQNTNFQSVDPSKLFTNPTTGFLAASSQVSQNPFNISPTNFEPPPQREIATPQLNVNINRHCFPHSTHTISQQAVQSLGQTSIAPKKRSAIVPPLQQTSIPRHKRTRFRSPRTEPFTKARVEAPGVCMQCKITGKACSGATLGVPCESCISFYSIHFAGSKNPCAKAAFIENIQWGSYFFPSSIFEYFLTYNSGHQQLVYRRILEEVQTIAETTPRIKLVSIQDNLTCEVETSTILNITQSILGVMENGGFRWPTIPSAHLISVIYGKAQEEGQHSFVTLRSGSETEDLGIYHKILDFCSSNAFGCPDEIGLIYQRTEQATHGAIIGYHRILEYIHYIVTRYLELRMFKKLQGFSTSAGDLPRLNKTQDIPLLMLRILRSGAQTPELSAQCYSEDSPQSALKECIQRREEILKALRIFSIYKRKSLSSNSRIWADIGNSSLHLLEILGASLAIEASFDYAIELRIFEDIFPTKSDFFYGRNCVLRVLGAVSANILRQKTTKTHFPHMFSAFGLAYLEDLRFDSFFRYPTQENCISLRRSLITGHLFLALSNFTWGCQSDPLQFSLGEIVLQNILHRRQLISVYDTLRGAFTQGDSSYWKDSRALSNYIERPSNSSLNYKRIALCLRMGKRWKELVLMFGEAIILIGSPFISDIPLLDIPRIIEEATDQVFDCVKRVLQDYFWWLYDICQILAEPLVLLAQFRGPTIDDAIFQNMESKVSSVALRINPLRMVLGELRPIVSGIPVQELAAGLVSQRECYPLDVLQCIDALGQCLIECPPQSYEEVHTFRNEAVNRVLRNSSLFEAREHIEDIIDKIILSFGVFHE